MQDLASAFTTAFGLILSLDPAVLAIVALSLRVSLSALVLAALIGLPLGALLAVARFPGRGGVIALCNALMGLPPVVVGLPMVCCSLRPMRHPSSRGRNW